MHFSMNLCTTQINHSLIKSGFIIEKPSVFLDWNLLDCHSKYNAGGSMKSGVLVYSVIRTSCGEPWPKLPATIYSSAVEEDEEEDQRRDWRANGWTGWAQMRVPVLCRVEQRHPQVCVCVYVCLLVRMAVTSASKTCISLFFHQEEPENRDGTHLLLGQREPKLSVWHAVRRGGLKSAWRQNARFSNGPGWNQRS